MASSTVLVEPGAEPVLVADAMVSLRIDEPELAPDLERKLLAARQVAEFKTGRALITQTRRLQLRSWPEPLDEYGPAVLLDFLPVQSIVALGYWADGEWKSVQTSGLEILEIDKVTCAVIPISGGWPELGDKPGYRIRLDFRCGYGDAGTAVPEPIRQYIVASAGHALMFPAAEGDAPNEFLDRQLDGWRVWL